MLALNVCPFSGLTGNKQALVPTPHFEKHGGWEAIKGFKPG